MYVAEPRMFLAIAESRHQDDIDSPERRRRTHPPRRRTAETPPHGPFALVARVLARLHPAVP
jgi:hypothetical protein